MGLLSDIVFCEPTVGGQIGAAIVQLLLWSFITNYDYGVMAHVHKYVKRQPWYPTVQENMKDDDAQVIWDFPDPGFNYVTFFQTIMHHGGGGVLMSLGMLLGQPWLWRHGMLVEVGGMDLLDAFRIANVKFFPPGTFPTNVFLKSKLFGPLMAFHHSVGLCVGIPVNMYFSEIYEFQLFGLMTLGFPAICLGPGLIIKTLDKAKYARLLFAEQMWVFLTFSLGSRTIFYFPAAWSCFLHVWRSPFGSNWNVILPFTWALLAMSAFNLMILGIQLNSFYKRLFGKDTLHAVRRSSSSLTDIVASVSVEFGLTNMFVASRLVARAHKAKDRVKEQHTKDQ
ncbi:unnamed protein product [Polarella glacialis]|uniref:TLC domain-containing protein n=1 Tax=Polarella glacialis TaxID=89957 RepID=A0A813G9H5_POLGL|nr:unnamed protein product [Polarella glacialis]